MWGRVRDLLAEVPGQLLYFYEGVGGGGKSGGCRGRDVDDCFEDDGSGRPYDV